MPEIALGISIAAFVMTAVIMFRHKVYYDRLLDLEDDFEDLDDWRENFVSGVTNSIKEAP